MTFVNGFDIEEFVYIFKNDRLLNGAAQYLLDYRDELNSKTDGWAYWSLGTRCADSLAEILTNAKDVRMRRYDARTEPKQVTEAEIVAACKKIAKFCATNRYTIQYGIKAPVLRF